MSDSVYRLFVSCVFADIFVVIFYIYSRFEPFLLLCFTKTLLIQMDNLHCILLPAFLLLLLTLFHQYYFIYVYIFYNKRIVAFM